MTQQEEWRPIPGFPGYEVSDLGRVLSRRRSSPLILKLTVNPQNGYLYAGMQRGGRTQTKSVHSLVATAFHGARPAGLEVRHLDGNGLNNEATNLTYGTHAENMQDRTRHRTCVNANKTHCLRGHEFTPENTYVNRLDGGRSCKTCRRAARAACDQRKALQAAGIAA